MGNFSKTETINQFHVQQNTCETKYIAQERKSAKYRFIGNFEGHFFIHLLVSNSLKRYKH